MNKEIKTPSAIELQAVCETFKLSKEDIARMVHKKPYTIGEWLCGRTPINLTAWELLLYKLGIKPNQVEGIAKEYVQTHLDHKTPTIGPAVTKKTANIMPMREFKASLKDLMVATHQQELTLCGPKDIRFIDLFAGIGGIRSAFAATGAKCVFSSEYDIFAQYTYYANYHIVPYGDIREIKAEQIPHYDILCAGFPCQPFSHIGKRQGFKHPTQGTMFYEIVRLLSSLDLEARPNAIFLENVPGLLNHDNGRTYKIIEQSLCDLGYKKPSYTTLNAKDFGVPQSRERFYLVAFKGDKKFVFPKAPMEHADIGDYLETNVDGYSISKHLQDVYLFKKDDGRPVLVDRNTKGPMKTLVCSYHKIQRLTGTFVKDGPTGIRLLTESECKAAMGFDSGFIFPVSRTQMYRQMGNSVVVKVVQAIATKLVKEVREMSRHKSR